MIIFEYFQGTSSILGNYREFPKIFDELDSGTLLMEGHCTLQVQLYEDFAKSQVKKGLEETVSHIDDDKKDEKASKDNPRIFQVGFSHRHLRHHYC